MDLIAALKHVKKGKKIMRESWGNQEIFVSLNSAILTITYDSSEQISTLAEQRFHPWTITESDLLADDWEIVIDKYEGIRSYSKKV